MVDKNELVVKYIQKKIVDVKLGFLVKGISNLNPVEISKEISKILKKKIYLISVGYEENPIINDEYIVFSNKIEEAVDLRSKRIVDGIILTFVKEDADKLHSLSEFELITSRNLAELLLSSKAEASPNEPIKNFWKALKESSDFFNLDILLTFVTEVENDEKTIPNSLWMLNMMNDPSVLSTNQSVRDRLKKNRELIEQIGQLSETARKNMSLTLNKADDNSRKKLQTTYRKTHEYFKFGNRETLKVITFDEVNQLVNATKNTTNKPKINGGKVKENVRAINSKEFDAIISDILISEAPDQEDIESLEQLYNELESKYEDENNNFENELTPVGGAFEDRKLNIGNPNIEFRKIIGQSCSLSFWGGVLKTSKHTLKEALNTEGEEIEFFSPINEKVANRLDHDGSTVFDFLIRFDEKLKDEFPTFSELTENIISNRSILLEHLDIILYHPVLAFGVDLELRAALISYIESWTSLLHVYLKREIKMHEISPQGSKYVAQALISLDVLFINTPTEWKGMLLPVHPLHLWRYYEIFKDFESSTKELSSSDKQVLKDVIDNLPQVMNVLIVDEKISKLNKNIELPCSGTFENLPTFENKTNKYLGEDGIDGVSEIIDRWLNFAPYSSNEVRICTVDVPNISIVMKDLNEYLKNRTVKKFVYYAYFTRKQNANTFLSYLDYTGNDYLIAENLRNGSLELVIKNLDSAKEVKEDLGKHPVHLAFYFDQASYSIEYVSNNKKLYISPLVVNYDYYFDEITNIGTIYPSSDMDSGLIGDYHKVLRLADVISNAGTPVTKFNVNSDLSDVSSIIMGGQSQWLFVADRSLGNYYPENSIPIGEKIYGRRTTGIWASKSSRVIKQYFSLLRQYNLQPKENDLLDLLSNYGHISTEGLISIPRNNSNQKQKQNRQKGLIGTLFAAKWFNQEFQSKNGNSLIASLDTAEARLWLNNQPNRDERADLIGLSFDEEKSILHVMPIEVKTRDESADATINLVNETISGHAADQVANVVKLLREIFGLVVSESPDMFVSARREVLKYQIISECFREIYDPDWQKKWSNIMKDAFSTSKEGGLKIEITGMLIHVKLSESKKGKRIDCIHAEENIPVSYIQLTSKDIQDEILSEASALGDDFVEDTIDVNAPLNHIEIETNSNDNPDIYLPEKNILELPLVEEKDEIILENNLETEKLVQAFKLGCQNYRISLAEVDTKRTVVGSSIIRIIFKLAKGQSLQPLKKNLEDIGREMQRTGILIQQIPNSNELALDIPKLVRNPVLFNSVTKKIEVKSPENLNFTLGRSPEGEDVIKNLADMPHMLVAGSTGSGKTVFLWTILASLLQAHPNPNDLQIVLSSSGLEDFVHFEGLPHLINGQVISDAFTATEVIKETVFKEFKNREKILSEAKVSNIIEYNKKHEKKLCPIVVIIDEFADLTDQFEKKQDRDSFLTPVQRIAQIGRKRGIHLILCTQRPSANLVPPGIKAQLMGRVALRVNDGISSRMIIDDSGAEHLQNKGDMIYKNGSEVERVQGYLITTEEIERITTEIKRDIAK